ncbi:MAG: hypothetical protein IJX50_00145 [Clostridia bacterium]|nr:hypothetical protein [Clostridia bacterium]
MNAAEAERAFWEMLPCEMATVDVSLGEKLKFDAPIELIYIRDESMLTRMALVFKTGERCISRYSIERLKLSDEGSKQDD